MKLKKLLQGTAFTVLATTVCLGTGKTDASAKISNNSVKIDTEEQKMIVTPEANDREVMISVVKKGKKKGNIVFRISQWDIYEINGAQEVKIDLSKLSNVKENFIAVKTENMDKPFIVRIPSAAKVNVITYNAEKNELDFKAGDKKRDVKAAESFQYKLPYGDWSEPEALTEGKKTDIFEQYQHQGVGMYLRTSATKSKEALTANNGDYKNVYDASNLDTKLDVYDSGSFPGKITKVNIAKQAKGPAVSVQYGAGTVTLPKAVEYRVLVKNNSTNTYEFKTFEDVVAQTNESETAYSGNETKTIATADTSKATTGVKVTDLLSLSKGQPAAQGASGVLEVRTAAKANDSSPKKAKCASKWTRIEIEVTTPFTDTELGGQDVIKNASSIVEKTDDKDTYGDAGVKNAKIVKDGNQVITVAYGSAKYSDADKKWNGTVRFTNIGNDSYQIVVSEENVDSIDKLDTKNAKTLASRGSSASKMLSCTNIKDGSYIYIRRAGSQNTKTWAGVYRLFGVVDFPKNKADEVTSTATPAPETPEMSNQ